MSRYFCADCRQRVEIDRLGYCEHCGGRAVTLALPSRCLVCGRGLDAGVMIGGVLHRECLKKWREEKRNALMVCC
jgi:hypothetical protein